MLELVPAGTEVPNLGLIRSLISQEGDIDAWSGGNKNDIGEEDPDDDWLRDLDNNFRKSCGVDVILSVTF